MNSLKRLTAVFLAVLMLASIAVTAAYAEEATDTSTWYAVGSINLFGVSWAPKESSKMTWTNGVLNVTIYDVEEGTYPFKVQEITMSNETIWHPDGMGNDSTVTVEKDGSTVRICLVPTGRNSDDVPYGEVFAPGEEVPEITAPTEATTVPTTAEPIPEGVLKVNTSSNFSESATCSYDTSANKELTVSYKLRADSPIVNSQGYVTYDNTALEVKDFSMSGKLPNPTFNTALYNKITFNSTDVEHPADFSQEDVFVTATFKILKPGETDVALTIEELNTLGDDSSRVGLITDSAVVDPAKVGGSSELSTPQVPTETTQATEVTEATQPTQAPTQPKVTSIKVTAAKKTIYVNASTTVKATVTNPVGKTTFTSSNTKIATVSAAGKVVGKKAGTVTITAKNNGKSASVKIKVIKRANTIKASGKTITIKLAKKAKSVPKTKKYAKTKAFKVTSAKGTVVYKKTKGNKKITVTSKGAVTVKKGLKKGTYKVTVKITAKGTTAYSAKTKTVTFKVVVK